MAKDTLNSMHNVVPIEPKKRIEILDVLRGFALLGIIFNNILYFSGYSFIPLNDLRLTPTFQTDEKIYQLLDIIVTGKFYTLFSMLFAAGFYLQLSRYGNNNTGFLKTYRRRLLILLLIGLIHVLIWFGDILFLYALIGFILILFRNIKTKIIFRWSLFFLLLPVIIDFILLPFFSTPDTLVAGHHDPAAHTNYPDMTAEEVVETFRYGTIRELFVLNIHNYIWKWLSYLLSRRIFTVLGTFLLGYYLCATGFFQERTKSTKLLIFSFIIGLSASVATGISGGSQFRFPPTLYDILYKILLLAGQIFLCFFYITLIYKIVQTPCGKRMLSYLKPVGRMALTNYISQTLLLIIVFYNFGFDLFGKLSLIAVCGIAVSVLVFQIIVSNIWLKYFRFGPLEWIWRCLTYNKRLKIRYE
ncbi:MAG: DUF418 domain-containing protein [Bacteroidales bacterium]|nr:DUF418 domain-containing protein [Bacteroidales bacterium]